MKNLIYIILVLSLFGCEQPVLVSNPEQFDEYVFDMTLYSFQKKQAGILFKTTDPDFDYYNMHDYTRFADDAVVTINQDTLLEVPSDKIGQAEYANFWFSYNYHHPYITVTNGQAYSVKITLSDGFIASGQTVVPDTAKILPVEEDEKYYTISWVGPDSLSYYFELKYSEKDANGHPLGSKKEFIDYYNGFSRHARVAKSEISNNYVYFISIYTFDQNNTRYLTEKVNSAGLNGIHGVFGSMCRARKQAIFP
jgi:hypothetical protein